MLQTKCILAPKEKSDGVRISVMSRHALNDGITPDKRITSECFDEWLQNVAPPGTLVGVWYRKEVTWEEFETKYFAALELPKRKQAVQTLAQRALTEDITLLCIETTPEYCHRRLLAEKCQELYPGLEVTYL